jgi:hypothetical protein
VSIPKIQPIDQVLRKRVLQSCGVAMLCAAGWYLGVRELEKKFVESKIELAQMRAKADEYSVLSLEDDEVSARLGLVQSRLESVKQWSDASADPTATYDAIANLATVHNVSLDSSNPSGGGSISGVQPPDQKEWPKVDMKATPLYTYTPATSGSKIVVTGTYADVCKFMSDCQKDLGLAKVTEFRLSAVDGDDPDLVQASIDIQHFRFERTQLVEQKAATRRGRSREK